jgi:hypothetical protein
MIPLRCHVHETQTPSSSSSSVGVKQGYLCVLVSQQESFVSAARYGKRPRYSRELGSSIIHDPCLQGDDSLEIFGRRRVLECRPELPGLAVILTDREAQRCPRAPILRLVVASPFVTSDLASPSTVEDADLPDNSSIPQGGHAMARIVVGQRCPVRWPPRLTVVGRVRLDDAPHTGSHRHVTVSQLVFGLPDSRLDDTLSRKAAVGFSAIRRQLDEIGTGPLVSLLEIIAGPGFRRDVGPSVLQMRVSHCTRGAGAVVGSNGEGIICWRERTHTP